MLDTHAQPQVAGTRLRMRVLLRAVELADTDAVRLVDADTGAEETITGTAGAMNPQRLHLDFS